MVLNSFKAPRIQNLFASHKSFKLHETKMINMQRTIDKSTIIVGDLIMPTIITDIMRRQKASKDVGGNTINQSDLIGNYRTFH